MKRIPILIADDHEMVRVGLRALLETYEDVEIVGDTGSLDRLPGLVERLQPRVLLLDVKFPGGHSFEACRRLKATHPELGVLFLTSHGNESVVVQCIENRGDGFLLKDVASEELVAAIRKVAAGQSILDASMTAKVYTQLQKRMILEAGGVEYPLPEDEALTPQEMRVLKLVAEGLTNREIAERMGLSPKTVKNYLSNLMSKLGFKRRAQAAAYFVKHFGEAEG